MFQLCHQFAILLFFFFQMFCFKFKLFFSSVTFHKFQNSPNFCQTLNILSNSLVFNFFSDIPIFFFFILFSPCLAFLAGFLVGPTLFKFRLKFS